MAGKPTRKDFSNLDPGGVLKNSHSQRADALRVINSDNIVGQYWSHVTLEYDSNDSVSVANFYYDTKRGIYEILTNADVSGSLNNKYFLINSGRNEKKFYVWFNVDGLGIDPSVINREGIEIPLNSDDSAAMVAYALQLILNMKDEFNVKRETANLNKIVIENEVIGTASIADFNTGFSFNTIQEGLSELIKAYEFEQQPDVKYVYNPYSKTFEVIPTSDIEVTLESSANNAEVVNLTLMNANQEYSLPLPDDTKKFLIKLRENDASLKLKFETSGNVLTLRRGNYYKEENLLTENVELFFETDKAGKTIELIYWT